MPELPEVESICRMLQERLGGRTVSAVKVMLPRIIRRGKLEDIVGSKIKSVFRKGKFICFEIDNNLRMYAHLCMTGTFLWRDDLTESPSHVRAEIKLDDGFLLYRDVRTLGGIWVAKDGFTPWKRLGIDPFDQGFTPKELQRRLHGRRIAVKQALMDQSLIAGIGNIYASEVLWRAGIHPTRSAATLNIEETTRLRNAVVKILSTAILSGGTTFRDFRLSDGRNGAFQDFLTVSAKEGKPCPKCRSSIERIVQAQRSAYFCPVCQWEMKVRSCRK